MTGDFNDEGLVDEIEGLTLGQMIELEDWIKFYDTSYTYVGKVIYAGRKTLFNDIDIMMI